MGSEYKSIKRPNFFKEKEKQWSIFSEFKNDFTSELEWWDRANAIVKTLH